ncbi:CLUMA_CG007779, isoform A [Clunio marinus]|uniref:CLUMA_CG007779, isoform A n=1 Tax=Clunio marinus TaxID=568069 RepID=A0A1J1I1R1_9DIPT|nr:CLUMA_CG007779, isoform A [Clunio marinus]
MPQITKFYFERFHKEFIWTVFGVQDYEFPQNFSLKTESFPFELTDESWFIKLIKVDRNLSFSVECENFPSSILNLDVKIIVEPENEYSIDEVVFSPEFCSEYFSLDHTAMSFQFKISYGVFCASTVTEMETLDETDENDIYDIIETPNASSEELEVVSIDDEEVDHNSNIMTAVNEPADDDDHQEDYFNWIVNLWDEENSTTSEESEQEAIDDVEEEEIEESLVEDQNGNASWSREASSIEEEWERQAEMIIDPKIHEYTQQAFEHIPVFLDIINDEKPEKWEYLQSLWRDLNGVGIPVEYINVWESVLYDHITLENFFNMLKLANICNLEGLRDFIITDFISEYDNEELLNSDGWKKLELAENREFYKVIMVKLIKSKR